MKKMILRAAGASMMIAVAALFGQVAVSPVRTVNADPANIVMFNPGLCLALGQPTVLSGCLTNTGLEYDSVVGDANLLQAAQVIGGTNTITPASFAGLATFTGGQIHQQSGDYALGSDSELAVAAFVNTVSPVSFHTSAGYWVETGALKSQDWTCTGFGAVDADSDCGGPNSQSSSPQLASDRVVVAYLSCSSATCQHLGPAQLTVTQGSIVYPMSFTVVGEARSVKITTFKPDAVQAGVPNGVNGLPSCPLTATVAGFTQALGEAEKTVIIARAEDINGTDIAGAWINWSVDNAAQGVIAGPETPTLNLGGFGYGAPNILCVPATAKAGTVTVTAQLARAAAGAVAVDPEANPGIDPGNILSKNLSKQATTFYVVGQPAAVTLAAAPSSIPCDGAASSTVTAAIVDGAGNKALSGTAVHFDVQTLGTANPINTTTDKDGIATTVVTPLSGAARGVPVTASVMVGGVPEPNLTQQILVSCSNSPAPAAGTSPAAGGPSGGAGGAGAGPAAGGSTGTITGPNTGNAGTASGVGSLSWWPLVVLALGAAALTASRWSMARGSRRR